MGETKRASQEKKKSKRRFFGEFKLIEKNGEYLVRTPQLLFFTHTHIYIRFINFYGFFLALLRYYIKFYLLPLLLLLLLLLLFFLLLLLLLFSLWYFFGHLQHFWTKTMVFR